MRIPIITKLATILVLLLGTSVNGLFFHYPKNALLDFFQSFHHKKEVKKPTQNIHHYHMHYYPVHTQILTKPVRAPIKIELEKLHSNHLEALGWNDNEYQHVPEPEIYHSSSPLDDAWPESSLTRPASIWDPEIPRISPNALEEPEVTKAGIVVQVPLHQTIILQQPPSKEEKKVTNPLIAFFQGIKRIKNSLFSHHDESEKTDYWNEKSTISDKLNAYVVYAHPAFGTTFSIILQQPPSKEEKKVTNPLIAFFQGIKRIKNSLFSHHDESEKTDYWNEKSTISDKLNAYVVYAHPAFGRKL